MCVCLLLPLCVWWLCCQLPLRCKVEVNSFSAHADFDQTKGFLAELQPPHVVLVHGEVTGMMQLRNVSTEEHQLLHIVRCLVHSALTGQ